MSSARNVQFERARALGSMGNNGLGFIDLPIINIRSPRQQKLLLGATLVYAGLGFPGAENVVKELKKTLKFRKVATAKGATTVAGLYIITLGVMNA